MMFRDALIRSARRLAWVTRLTMLVTVLASAYVLFAGGPLALLTVPAAIRLAPAMPSSAWLVGPMLGLLVPAVSLWAQHTLHRLLGRFAQGQVFADASIAALRSLGVALIAIDVARLLVSVASGPLLTLIGATEPFIEVRLEASWALVGALLMILAVAMNRAQVLEEQATLTI